MSAPRSLAPQQQQQKRKSAVELLAETKAFYVKSETVLDRKQELPLRVSIFPTSTAIRIFLLSWLNTGCLSR